MPEIFLLALVAACNLTLLSAMAAGRSESRWRQRLLVVAGFSLLLLALVAAAALSWVMGFQDQRVGLVAVLALVVAMPLAGLLAYLEYWLVGMRPRFGTDLRRSMWWGRYGMVRLAGRGDPQMAAAEQHLSSALASGDQGALAAALNEVAGQIESLQQEGAGNPQIASAVNELKAASQQLARQADRDP